MTFWKDDFLAFSNVTMSLSRRQFIAPRWVLVVASFEKLFLIINSSLNFVIYCLAGKGFRQQMCNLLFRYTFTTLFDLLILIS